jgi:hypothetical protein
MIIGDMSGFSGAAVAVAGARERAARTAPAIAMGKRMVGHLGECREWLSNHAQLHPAV